MRFIGGLLLLLTLICVSPANAYQLEGLKWPQPTTTFYVDIPGAEGLWNDSFETAMYHWGVDTIFEYKIVRGVYEDPCDPPEGRNGVSFESTACGDAWGRTTIAVTWMTFIGSTFYQTDIIFNSNESWNVYSTSWWSGPFFGINDFQRVAVHELGHALGLDDEDSGVPTIMTPYAGNITIPQQDDIKGVAAIYGVPVPIYFDTVQKVFIGYYQRPAGPGGLIYWATRLDASDGSLNEIIETFANSAESQALYGPINSTNISSVVTSIFQALFDRAPAQAGLNYYVNGFNSGRFTPATIMLNVLDGAQNKDLQSVNNKVTASNLFTRTIDPDLDGMNFQATYSGDTDAQKAREWLSTVGWDPVTIPTQVDVTLFIKNNIADPGDPILNP